MLVRKELLSPEWAERILSWPHSGFNVHSLVRAKTKIEAERPKRVPAVPIVRPKPPRYTPPPTHPWKVYQGPAASDTPVRP